MSGLSGATIPLVRVTASVMRSGPMTGCAGLFVRHGPGLAV
jgi:hypothetical protein